MGRLLESQVVLKERYKIVSPIGQGGMGAVYRAADLLLPGRVCALKEISANPDIEPEILAELQEQFRREAEVLARLDHPNLPKVSDYFTQEQREYLVMDFVPGYDLREIITQARERGEFLEESQVLKWADQLCSALSYLHAQAPPILHRDVKPSNIKLTPAGFIKLVAFGLVKIMTSDEARTITVVQGRGTAAYTPLEQYGQDENHTDARSDIYALGATLYHLLTGKSPATAQERFLRPTALVAPRALNPRISPGVEHALLRALALHPDERPPDVITWQQLLHETAPPLLMGNPLTLRDWGMALRANLPLIAATALLLVFAVVLTP